MVPSPSYFVTTTNHAESYHQKIKKHLNSKRKFRQSIFTLIAKRKATLRNRNISSSAASASLKYNTEEKFRFMLWKGKKEFQVYGVQPIWVHGLGAIILEMLVSIGVTL